MNGKPDGAGSGDNSIESLLTEIHQLLDDVIGPETRQTNNPTSSPTSTSLQRHDSVDLRIESSFFRINQLVTNLIRDNHQLARLGPQQGETRQEYLLRLREQLPP